MKSLCFYLLLILACGAAWADESKPSAPTPTPTVKEEAKAPKTDAAAKAAPVKRTQLYSLDYDEDADLFLVPGTKTPFTGPVVSTYDNGVTELVGDLTNGQRTGWWVEFAENGQKTSQGIRKKDVEDGLWTYWSENGQLAAQGFYKEGSAIGKWVTFFENGKPDSSGNYKNGVMDGSWIFHDAQTGEEQTVVFDMGVQLKK